MTASSTPSCSTTNDGNAAPISISFFQKSVCLKDWWLVKADNDSGEKRLAVAGVTSREKQAVRVFSSAPILRRHDVFTLETVDNICIIFKGFLDKARTEENGFPSEVCDHFVFGFPPYWEIYSLNCFGREALINGAAPSVTDSGRLSPQKQTASEASERVSSQRYSVVETTKVPETSENSPGNIRWQPVVPSVLGEKDVHLSEQNNVNDPHKDKDINSPQILRKSSACQRKIHASPSLSKEINDYNLSAKPDELPRTGKKSSEEIEFRKEKDSANDITGQCGGSGSKHSLGDTLNPFDHLLQSKPQSNFVISRASGYGENAICSNVKDSSASSIPSLPTTGLQNLEDEIIRRTPDSTSTDDDYSRRKRTSHNDEGMNGDQTKQHFSAKAKKSNKSLCSSSGVKRKINAATSEENIFQPLDCCGKKSRRNQESCASWKEKDESIFSPESLSLNRSRSGRLLLPTLEFWRNQRAIYDVNRHIIGIRDLQISKLSKGSKSEPQRKRRLL